MASVQDRLEQARRSQRGYTPKIGLYTAEYGQIWLRLPVQDGVKDQPIVAAMRQYSEKYPR